jgi:hypothetical protein
MAFDVEAFFFLKKFKKNTVVVVAHLNDPRSDFDEIN